MASGLRQVVAVEGERVPVLPQPRQIHCQRARVSHADVRAFLASSR